MGLAALFQTVLVLNRAGNDLSECIRHYKDGIRLLYEGDPGPANAQTGILLARQASIVAGGRLEYQDNSTGQRYRVWIQNGQLLRRRFPFAMAFPQKILMGDPITVPPVNRVYLAPDTSPANPMAVIQASVPPAPRTLIRFSLHLNKDQNADDRQGQEELFFQASPSVFLRNSERIN